HSGIVMDDGEDHAACCILLMRVMPASYFLAIISINQQIVVHRSKRDRWLLSFHGNSMTIRLRISLFVVLTFLAISFIGSYAVFQSRNSALEVRAVTEGMMPSVLASSDLVGQLKDVQLASLSMLNETDAQLMSQAGERLANGKNLLQQGLDFQLKHATGGAQQGLVEQSRETLDNYFAAIDSVMQFKQAGRADIAQATYFGNVVQYQNELEDIVQTLRVEKNRSKDV